MGSPFYFSGELGIFRSAGKWVRLELKLGRLLRASRRRQIEAEYVTETAEAPAAAIASDCTPRPIIERAERRKAEAAEPLRPPVDPLGLLGSATWVGANGLSRLLKGRTHFDSPSSNLFGTFFDDDAQQPARFVPWNGAGHPLTSTHYYDPLKSSGAAFNSSDQSRSN